MSNWGGARSNAGRPASVGETRPISLPVEMHEHLETLASLRGISKSALLRKVIQKGIEVMPDFYEIRIERGGDREFVPTNGEMSEEEAITLYNQWVADPDVTQVWLKQNGEFLKVYKKGDTNMECQHEDTRDESIPDVEGKRTICNACGEVVAESRVVPIDDDEE